MTPDPECWVLALKPLLVLRPGRPLAKDLAPRQNPLCSLGPLAQNLGFWLGSQSGTELSAKSIYFKWEFGDPIPMATPENRGFKKMEIQFFPQKIIVCQQVLVKS